MVSRDAFNVFIAVYMMASRRHGTIYTGVTSNLPNRAGQHRDGRIEGFTKKYRVKRLVWYEQHESFLLAIRREKSLKKYPREWKINLIERENPTWDDLFPTLVGLHRNSHNELIEGDDSKVNAISSGVHGSPGQARR